MGETMQLDKYECVKQQLLQQQEIVEKTSMDTLNQHDKLTASVRQLTDELDQMISRLEALNYGMEIIATEFEKKECQQRRKRSRLFPRY